MVCEDDGSAWRSAHDCADWEVACGEGGYCEDACAVAEAQRSYVGCEHSATPLPHSPDLVPQEQFRTDYAFVTPTSDAPTTGGQSWVLVSREPGVAITLEGEELGAAWARVGDRELAIVPLAGGACARASTPFGVVAYGLGEYTSYAYPAGLDLRTIPF